MRGKINNRQAAQQIRDFSGLRWKNITPTDIDGLIEYQGRGFIFIETKFGDAKLPYGQRLALARLVDGLSKPSICLITRHTTRPEDDIDMANSIVTEYYWHGKWTTTKPIKLKDAIDGFIRKQFMPF